MAKIVMIAAASKRDVNNIGDIVCVHDDDVELGPAYDSFSVITVVGTAAKVREDLAAKLPEIRGDNEPTEFYDKVGKRWEPIGDFKYALNLKTSSVDGAVTNIKKGR